MTLKPRPYLREVILKREEIASFESYPFSIAAVRMLEELEFHPDVTYIVGENGCGKSTLLEAIAVAWGFNAEGGTVNFRFATRDSHSELHQHLRLVRSVRRPRDGFFLRAESFFNVATSVDELEIVGSYGGVSLHEQSHGESFLALMLDRFGGDGLYILDEPEAALSPTRQLVALRRIHDLVRSDSQFIIATHSPILMAYPGSKIYLVDGAGFREVRYEETEHYMVTRKFLEDPQRMLDQLLSDEDEDEDDDET